MRIPVYWVDAFTEKPLGGNPAVVVPQADDLTEAQMQGIAHEVNCSETAFICPTTITEADLRLRWFSPTQEVDLCGHATVAALHVLAQEQRFNLRPGTLQYLYLETRSGLLTASVDQTQDHRIGIWLSLPLCTFELLAAPEIHTLQTLLGVKPMTDPAPVMDSLNRDVLLSVEKLHTLHGLKPQLESMAAFNRQQGWRGVCIYTLDTQIPSHTAHLRFFAPNMGITEDPVTGSVSVPLALYLHQQAASLPATNLDVATAMTFEQGDCLGRPGRLQVDLGSGSPRLGGHAVTVMRGEFEL
ncbi:PhzF family phenazine biosynthesis isomerase [Synechococcales cyanobacterium C]|uniref:PhzF family phenazine biosynthesis isomerase n=1 Tax=Petrachloros mirabilis ULC683 TaxID=2781853 RepID=A0A8K2A9P5_9CYAN|nr:PhzF family phenazine biosynthesis protein [Petrachloros mirabilis]NCJ08410.1 PhzF family phenazine biosynthesis isomerase [Petrachloros mirabilis ULC683]